MLRKPQNIPTRSGIYLFRRGSKILYIGKATSLKRRVLSYFRKNVGAKIANLIQETASLKFVETESETAALIKEAELIKKYQPKYNYLLRDDKNYFYVGVTKEAFPRVFMTHQPERVKNLKLTFEHRASGRGKVKSVRYIGPFTSGASLKTVLKLLRRIFPYCTCKNSHKRPCLNAQIGKCFGYCCGSNHPNPSEEEYQKNIKNMAGVLNGRSKNLIRSLRKEMGMAAKKQEFEKAAKLRDQISGLENVFSHQSFLAKYPEKHPDDDWFKIEKGLKIILGMENNISRTEGYDISNIFGQEATGSMVVFVNGKPARNEYRKFKIKRVRQISDVDMLKEVISRRLQHLEWPYPELILIDGGKAQLNAVLGELRTYNLKPKIKAAALAKREEELYLPHRKFPLPLKNLSPALARFLQRARDESHRFARVYHHKLRQRLFDEK